jgi:RNA polymerase sigma-70 factor (ECF subfamily)
MDAAEELALVKRAQADLDAFGQLYRHYVKRIYNYHYRHTGNIVEAEDLTSQTFYRALRAINKYRHQGIPFQAWLFRIAHNLVVNWYRDHGRQKWVSIDNVDPLLSEAYSPHAQLETAEERQLLLDVIETLPEDRKTLIILKFVEKMTNVEIGVVLGKTEGAVKALYHRTLTSLRQKMRET